MRVLSIMLVVGVVAIASAHANELVEKRVVRFKQNGTDIQAVFKKHIGAGDFDAIQEAAQRMAVWGDEMPEYFPEGSKSEGARDAIWKDFSDFKSKAAAFSLASRGLKKAAALGDKGVVKTAAQNLGGTCKACHKVYRIKK